MKTMKKFKITLANDIEKEAVWLTEMSAKGFHFFAYKWGFYYFEEDPAKSYIYQTDFQDADEEYFELYKQTGWEHVHTELSQFHYFRADKNTIGDKRIYSDPASVKSMYQRMFFFYIAIFVGMVAAQMGLLFTWSGETYQKIALVLVMAAILLYVYLFFRLLQKMRKNEKLIR